MASNAIASRTHACANPHANNTPNRINIPRRRHRTPKTRQEQSTPSTADSARADRASGARSTLCASSKHPTHARTTCEAARRCPRPPRRVNAPAAAPRNNLLPNDVPAHTAASERGTRTATPPVESRRAPPIQIAQELTDRHWIRNPRRARPPRSCVETRRIRPIRERDRAGAHARGARRWPLASRGWRGFESSIAPRTSPTSSRA